MWIAVTERFQRFNDTIQLLPSEIDDGLTKLLGVRRCLHTAYWGTPTGDPLGFMVGSWGKNTAIRPPGDIDVFMPLPLETYRRFDAYSGNGQSALLQEVKGHLEATYSQTRMRGDGQVVVVAFNTITVEVVPVFHGDNSGNWLMPDSNDGGKWKLTNPAAEVLKLDYSESGTPGNARRLVKMMKVWRDLKAVKIKSFQLEVLVAEFMESYHWRAQSFFFFDWVIRDFLYHMTTRRNGSIRAPNSGEWVPLGEDWYAHTVAAYAAAVEACEYERADLVASAGLKWQEIFGLKIQAVV